MSFPLIWNFEIFSWLCWQSQKMQGIYIIFIHIQSPLKASGLTNNFCFELSILLLCMWYSSISGTYDCGSYFLVCSVLAYRRRLSFHSRTSTQYHFSKLLHTTSQWESTELGAPSCSLHGVSAIQIAIQRLTNTKTNGRHSRRSMVSSNSYFDFYGQNTGKIVNLDRIERQKESFSLGACLEWSKHR